MFTLRGACAVLLLVVTMANAANAQQQQKDSWKQPAHCKGLDCPKYTVLKTLDGIELRKYEPGSWVSIKGTGMDRDSAMRGSFMKLFEYISGGNSRQAKIPMTAPVLTKIEPGQGPNCESTFTMSFYNPYAFQGAAAAASIPKPTGEGVFINSVPGMEVYVISYGGYSIAATERSKATELIQKLEAAKEPVDSSHWFVAGYDSPYQLQNRHNEVWIPKAAAAGAGGAAGTTTAAEAGKKAAAGR